VDRDGRIAVRPTGNLLSVSREFLVRLRGVSRVRRHSAPVNFLSSRIAPPSPQHFAARPEPMQPPPESKGHRAHLSHVIVHWPAPSQAVMVALGIEGVKPLLANACQLALKRYARPG